MQRLIILSPVGSYRHPRNAASIANLGQSFEISLSECFGYSEVSRARCEVARLAAGAIAEDPDCQVLWLDADMVVDVGTVLLQSELVRKINRPISGRYVRRQDETRVAASRPDPGSNYLRKWDTHDELKTDFGPAVVTLSPTLTGMGALMLPGPQFTEQYNCSPLSRSKVNGEAIESRLICCPRIIPDPNDKDGFQMLSEDFDYCNQLSRGTWLAEIKGENYSSWLDYGHVAEKVLMHSPKRHTLRDDR